MKFFVPLYGKCMPALYIATWHYNFCNGFEARFVVLKVVPIILHFSDTVASYLAISAKMSCLISKIIRDVDLSAY